MSCVKTPALPIMSMPVKNTAVPSGLGVASNAAGNPPLAPGVMLFPNGPVLQFVPPPVPPAPPVLPVVLLLLVPPTPLLLWLLLLASTPVEPDIVVALPPPQPGLVAAAAHATPKASAEPVRRRMP